MNLFPYNLPLAQRNALITAVPANGLGVTDRRIVASWGLGLAIGAALPLEGRATHGAMTQFDLLYRQMVEDEAAKINEFLFVDFKTVVDVARNYYCYRDALASDMILRIGKTNRAKPFAAQECFGDQDWCYFKSQEAAITAYMYEFASLIYGYREEAAKMALATLEREKAQS